MRWIREIFGVEKPIIAMCHLRAACGGDNRSAIHWDIVKDIRSEGAVFVDDRVILEGGNFFLDD